jgi:hypothetical protein
LKPTPADSLQDPISKNPITKNRAGGVTQAVECLPSKCEAEFKSQNCQKKKKKKRICFHDAAAIDFFIDTF